MQKSDNNHSKTGSKFLSAEKLISQVTKMPHVSTRESMRAVAKVLFQEFGKLKGLWILIKTGVWDDLFARPKWHPEYFQFNNKLEEKQYKSIFKSMIPLITIFNYLKKKYGLFRADEVVARMAIPISLPYLLKTFHHIDNLKDIDPVRQLTVNYLGDGLGFEWEERVSEDKKEVRYHFTKCVYGEILIAYGLKTFAVYSCLADHIVFDNVMPEIVFGRNNTITLGDTFCDHVIRIRQRKDTKKDEENYGDCYKIQGGRELVREWEDNYKKNNNQFKI